MHSQAVVVTGAFGTLGRSVCELLAARGARLALVDFTAAPPDLPAPLAGHVILPEVDLRNPTAVGAAIQKAAEQLGGIGALVNIAGGFRWETLEGGTAETWDAMFSMNVMTAVNACRAALPMLVTSGRGRIVNVSAAAALRAAAGMGAYAASKSGVLRLTESLAEELKDSGVTVNAVLPSIIDTPANRMAMGEANVSRWVAPSSLAALVAFLLSPAAADITGAAIPVMGRV